MRCCLALLLAAGLVVSAALQPAAAQSLADRRAHSTQCLLAMAMANGAAKEPRAKAAARLGMLFFTAQLSGIDPNIDLAAAARSQIPGLDTSRLQALIPDCGREINAREQQLTSLGQALKPPGK